MKQFRLKFTKENLNRHIAHDTHLIPTTRDKIKGELGDLTIIKMNIYEVVNIFPTTLRELQQPCNLCWKDEGFESQNEFINEIQRIYGNDPDKQLYTHILCWINSPMYYIYCSPQLLIHPGDDT